MDVIGVTVDMAVRDLDTSVAFYRLVLERAPDLYPSPGTAEWILRREPEIGLRLIVSDQVAATRVGLGVADVASEHRRLLGALDGVPAPQVRPGVIALLTLTDPDGHTVQLWQDLLERSQAT